MEGVGEQDWRDVKTHTQSAHVISVIEIEEQ